MTKGPPKWAALSSQSRSLPAGEPGELARHDDFRAVVRWIDRRCRLPRRRDGQEADRVAIPHGLLRLQRRVQRRNGGLASLLDLERDLGIASPDAHRVRGTPGVALDAPERELQVV